MQNYNVKEDGEFISMLPEHMTQSEELSAKIIP
jgi:hypothetical protein